MQGKAYLAGFQDIDWFASAGKPIELPNPRLKQINSWSAACEWTVHPVSQWCSMEAGKYLYEGLAEADYESFRGWNDVA